MHIHFCSADNADKSTKKWGSRQKEKEKERKHKTNQHKKHGVNQMQLDPIDGVVNAIAVQNVEGSHDVEFDA